MINPNRKYRRLFEIRKSAEIKAFTLHYYCTRICRNHTIGKTLPSQATQTQAKQADVLYIFVLGQLAFLYTLQTSMPPNGASFSSQT